jgi:fatty acid desaturase
VNDAVVALTPMVTMVPAVLPEACDTPDVRRDGKPTPALREELRRIASWRNALSVVSLYVQTAILVWLSVRYVWTLPITFVLMGRTFAQFASLMHEAAHRLLFADKGANDWVGRWVLGYPAFTSTDAYRRVHMAHHRDEFGPDEPDIPLYRGYPIPRDSMLRKLRRDAFAITGWKLTKGLFRGVVAEPVKVRHAARAVLATQLVMLGLFTLAGHPWMYFLLWFLPHLTVWRVINRLRSIAEHGGMRQSADRRETTHSVRQHLPARLTIVPYYTGWHLAHHVDSGIPMRNLPRLHDELIRAGYVQPELEYPSYPALWRALASG